MSYHLRPVSEDSDSQSPSVPDSPSQDHPFPLTDKQAQHSQSPPSSSTLTRSRRPMSPTSIRGKYHALDQLSPHSFRTPDVNLAPDADPQDHNYPAPPTGHDLMALFPPPAPSNFPENQPGHTSGYFAHQERAFFAQAGKEILRVGDVDFETDVETPRPKHRGPSRSWPTHTSPTHHAQPPAPPSSAPLPQQPPPSVAAPYPLPHSRPRTNPSAPVTVYQVPSSHGLSPVTPTIHSPPHYPIPTNRRSPPLDPIHPGPSADFSDEFRDDPDEAWRRPMPYAERRRAGKHTKRVIVRS